MSLSVYGLLYHSRASRPLSASDLRLILDAAHRNNPALGVTGLLFYGEAVGGRFAQWLEGPEPSVRSIYARIARDDRHADLCVVADGPADELTGGDVRLFPGWTMAFTTLDGVPDTLGGFLDHVREPLWG